MSSITPYCKADKTKSNGKAPIVIVVYKSGKRKYISTGLDVEPKYFDNKKQKFKSGSGDSVKLQAMLDSILIKLRGYDIANPNATAADIVASFKTSSDEDFISFAKGELFIDRKNLSYKAWKQYGYCINLIEKHWSSVIGFNEVTSDKVRIFDYAMQTAGLGVNTRRHALKTLKKYVRRAKLVGKIAIDPFENFKVGNYQNAEREWTDEDEIELLKELWENREEIPERLHGTLIHYLHSCHCGLRHIDSRRFNTKEHIEGNFISILPSKSAGIKQTKLRIPINEYAKYLHSSLDEYVLKASHSKTNENLKEICSLVGIEKHITFHCSRHSFAINSLIKGVPLEAISKWLGHTSVTTTQIYAKIVDSFSGAEMEKWNSSSDITVSLAELGLHGQFKTKAEAIDFLKEKLG